MIWVCLHLLWALVSELLATRRVSYPAQHRGEKCLGRLRLQRTLQEMRWYELARIYYLLLMFEWLINFACTECGKG